MKKMILAGAICALSSALYAQTIPAYVSTSNLEGWYPFTSNANNALGNGRNGVVHGATLTTDRFGAVNSAYHFDGDTQFIQIDTTFFNVGWSNFTTSCWINSESINNPNNGNNNQCVLNTKPHNGFAIDFNWHSSNKYSLWSNTNPAMPNWDIYLNQHMPGTITINNWNHIVAEKRNDTAYLFYVNGVLDTIMHATATASNYYCKMVFGTTDPDATSEVFWGKLDDYGIWSRALSPCEITRLYRSSAYLYITSQPSNVSTWPTSTVSFSVTDTGSVNTHQWQVNSGSGYSNVGAVPPYSGVTTSTLTITGVSASMHNYKYRCVVARTGGCTDTSAVGKLNVVTSGVNNVGSGMGISISPNPFNNEIFINGIKTPVVELRNNIGQLVRHISNTNNLSVADLPSGLYFITVYDEAGLTLYHDKMVKY